MSEIALKLQQKCIGYTFNIFPAKGTDRALDKEGTICTGERKRERKKEREKAKRGEEIGSLLPRRIPTETLATNLYNVFYLGPVAVH